MKWFMICATVMMLAIVVSMGCFSQITFKSNIEDNLKLAGDAPNVERANVFLIKALNAMEARGLTRGNSAIIFHMPTQDIGIWYEQIKGAQQTTAKIIKQEQAGLPVPQLERDNALMKIRETVMDQGKEGVVVTAPDNAWLYPFQLIFYSLICLTLLFGVIAALIVAADTY